MKKVKRFFFRLLFFMLFLPVAALLACGVLQLIESAIVKRADAILTAIAGEAIGRNSNEDSVVQDS